MKSIKNYLLFLLIWTCTFCNENHYRYPNNPNISDIRGNPKDSSIWYFPEDCITERLPYAKQAGIIDTFWHHLFSKELFKLQEPVLSNYYLGESVIRLAWIRSFDPVVVLRLTNNIGENYLFENGYFRQKDSFQTSYGFYQPRIKLINKRNVFKVNHQFYLKLDSLIETSKFYQLLSTDNTIVGLDGSEWILEVHQKDKYHLVWRGSPDSNDLIRKIGDQLINMSSYRYEERY
jgi:hypothetical protein